tara:strand:+ start:1405 stop:1671 length:267 start_codon:yes stop_codon:yes gene_type:complete
MANIFDGLFKDVSKKAEADRNKRFKAKFGNVTSKVGKIQTKLGKEDYELLKECFKSNITGYNSKEMIRLSLKLGMKNFAMMLYEDYYE